MGIQRGGRGNALNHRHPEGWWDSIRIRRSGPCRTRLRLVATNARPSDPRNAAALAQYVLVQDGPVGDGPS
eukprot:423335-Pyramimonas_sp.AAC.1